MLEADRNPRATSTFRSRCDEANEELNSPDQTMLARYRIDQPGWLWLITNRRALEEVGFDYDKALDKSNTNKLDRSYGGDEGVRALCDSLIQFSGESYKNKKSLDIILNSTLKYDYENQVVQMIEHKGYTGNLVEHEMELWYDAKLFIGLWKGYYYPSRQLGGLSVPMAIVNGFYLAWRCYVDRWERLREERRRRADIRA